MEHLQYLKISCFSIKGTGNVKYLILGMIGLSIVCFKNEPAFAKTVTPPSPVKVIDGERFENRTLKLLSNGKIVYAPDRESLIDKDGIIHSIVTESRYTIKGEYVGFQLKISKGGRVVSERFYNNSYSIGGLLYCLRDNNIIGFASMTQQISEKESRSFTLLIKLNTFQEISYIPLGMELISTPTGYYMVDLVTNNLIVYSLDLNFQKLNTYTVDRYVDFKSHITLDSHGMSHISYHNAKENTLKYARMKGGGFETYTIEMPESGVESSIDVDDRDVIIASYFYLNPYNKGSILYRIPLDSVNPVQSMKRCIFNRRKDENIGWAPTMSSNGREVAVSIYNRTLGKTEIYLISKDYIHAGNDFIPEGLELWMEQKKELNLYTEIGYNYLQWKTDVRTDFKDLTGVNIPAGEYRLDPTVVEGVGFGGEYGKTSFAFNYMRNTIVDKAKARDESAGKVVEYFAGKIGVEDVFGYGNTLELHTRKGLFKGEYTQNSVTRNFKTEYVDIDLDVFDRKGGFFWGLGYRNYKTPQPVVISENLQVIEQYVTSVDFNIYSLLGGYSNINYLRKFENRYSGFYIDAKGYLGIASLDLEQKPTKVKVEFPSAVVFRVDADIGYMVFKRFQSLRYLSTFLKIGFNIDYSYIGAGETKESVKEKKNVFPTINISRQDYLLGGFIKGGITF